MRWRAIALAGFGALVTATVGRAQELARGDPDSLRAPLLLASSSEDRTRHVTQLLFSQVLQAVESGDVAWLSLLVDDDAVPPAERAQSGCHSLADAVRSGTTPAGSSWPGGPKARRLAWGTVDAAVTGVGDTVARAKVTVAAREAGRERQFRVVAHLRREGDGLRIARVEGLHGGLCAITKR